MLSEKWILPRDIQLTSSQFIRLLCVNLSGRIHYYNKELVDLQHKLTIPIVENLKRLHNVAFRINNSHCLAMHSSITSPPLHTIKSIKKYFYCLKHIHVALTKVSIDYLHNVYLASISVVPFTKHTENVRNVCVLHAETLFQRKGNTL